MITDFSGNHGDGNGIMDLRRIQDLNLYRCYPGLLSTQMQYHYANPPMERERLELPMTEVVWSTARCHTIRRTLQEDSCEIRTHDVIRRSFCRRAQSTALATDQMLPTRIELVTLGSSRQSSTTELQKQEMHEARLELASLYLMKIALLPSKLLMQCPWQDSNLRLFRSTTELQGTIQLLAYQHTWQCICLFTCMCQANRKVEDLNSCRRYPLLVFKTSALPDSANLPPRSIARSGNGLHFTLPRCNLIAPFVGFRLTVTIWTKNEQVFKTMISINSVLVVQFKRNRLSIPFSDTTFFAFSLLSTGIEKSFSYGACRSTAFLCKKGRQRTVVFMLGELIFYNSPTNPPIRYPKALNAFTNASYFIIVRLNFIPIYGLHLIYLGHLNQLWFYVSLRDRDIACPHTHTRFTNLQTEGDLIKSQSLTSQSSSFLPLFSFCHTLPILSEVLFILLMSVITPICWCATCNQNTFFIPSLEGFDRHADKLCKFMRFVCFVIHVSILACLSMFVNTCLCFTRAKKYCLHVETGSSANVALTSNDSLHCSSLHRNLIAHAAYLGTAMMARRERRERRGDDGAMWAMWNEDGSERAMWWMKRHCNNDVTGFTNNSRIVLQSPLRCSTMLIYQESGKTKEGSHDNDGRIAYNRRCSASSQNIRIHCQTVVQTRRDKSQKDWQKLEGQTRRLARVYRPKTRRRDRKLKIKPAKCWQLFENLATASLASNLAWKLEMPSHTQRCHNVMIPYLAKKSKILCIETWACARKIRMPMRKNPQCHVCKQEYAVSIWQPDLDNETTLTFYRPGFHVRGFMAIHLGEQCKSMLENGETVTFTYKKQQFHANPHSIQHAHDEHSMIDALPSVESEDMR